MSIRSDAYEFCKAVFRAPLKEPLRKLIAELNSDPRIQPGDETDAAVPNRSMFGHLVHAWRAQLLSFLLLAERSGQPLSDRVPLIIPSLRPEERELFARGHVQILRLNEACLSPLLSRLPHYASAVDPYGDYARVSLPNQTGDDLLSSEAVATMARSFHNHPGFSVAMTSNPQSPAGAGQLDLAQSVKQLIDMFHKAGPMHEPKEIEEIISRQPKNSPPRIGLRHLGALASLRQSLAMLDQLVFQAVVVEKLRLPVIDEESIIALEKRGTTYVSTGSSVVYQPDAGTPHGGYENLILFKWARPYDAIDELCCVENLVMHVSEELGTTANISLRTVDEHLNPFGTLLNHA